MWSGNNFVDIHVLAKLKRLNIPPSAALADDAVFPRRLSLDVTGELPAPKEVREFLADKSADKRARKIDELLKRTGHAALWTMKFCDILKASDYGVYADAVDETHDAPRMQQWIRARLEENIPYDVFVERILTATSREGRSVEEWSKEVVALFEGYATPRTDLAVYSQRKTLDLYWQRRCTATWRLGNLASARTAFLGAAPRMRPVPSPSARRLAARRPVELRQLLHARPRLGLPRRQREALPRRRRLFQEV